MSRTSPRKSFTWCARRTCATGPSHPRTDPRRSGSVTVPPQTIYGCVTVGGYGRAIHMKRFGTVLIAAAALATFASGCKKKEQEAPKAEKGGDPTKTATPAGKVTINASGATFQK